MRPRIFSLMLTAFGLVIVLGIGGMLSFFWLAVVTFQKGRTDERPLNQVVVRAEAQRLAAFYAQRDSWAGVEPSFDEFERGLRTERWQSVTLVDAEGRVVRSSRPGMPHGAVAPLLPPAPMDGPGRSAGRDQLGEAQGLMVQTVPIQLRGEQIGTLLIVYDGGGPRAFSFSDGAHGLIGAGVALATILLGLAAFFSRRISTPLSQMNAAATALAGGDMRVRVRPGLVREVADLAVSFNRMADALAVADQQRRQLTADVAHELRTPLSIIKGRLEGVQDGIYRADDDQIEGLLGEVALLERLIEDLRILALADAGQLAFYPEASDPARMVDDTVRSFAQQAEERGVALRAEVDAALPELTADPQRIAQVLSNLVGNALRHTPAGGAVTLAVTTDEGRLTTDAPSGAVGVSGQPSFVFMVRDSGSGISAEDLPLIFDRFYRADRSRTRSSGGAGLGLAIARRIVEAHGGTIWAESAMGQGTTVHFTLPMSG